MPRRIFIANPNASRPMTDDMAAVARTIAPNGYEIESATNLDGPPAIQGAEDAEACLPGLFELVAGAALGTADSLVVGCFDDTGLIELRDKVPYPVIGLGEAGILAAGLAGSRFSILTTTAGSVPVIEENLAAMGLAHRCHGVVPAGIPVLDLPHRISDLRASLLGLPAEMKADPVVLGCAGMSVLVGDLVTPGGPRLVDPVRAAIFMAVCVSEASAPGAEASVELGHGVR